MRPLGRMSKAKILNSVYAEWGGVNSHKMSPSHLRVAFFSPVKLKFSCSRIENSNIILERIFVLSFNSLVVNRKVECGLRVGKVARTYGQLVNVHHFLCQGLHATLIRHGLCDICLLVVDGRPKGTVPLRYSRSGQFRLLLEGCLRIAGLYFSAQVIAVTSHYDICLRRCSFLNVVCLLGCTLRNHPAAASTYVQRSTQLRTRVN